MVRRIDWTPGFDDDAWLAILDGNAQRILGADAVEPVSGALGSPV
jgi:hypothetical protein